MWQAHTTTNRQNECKGRARQTETSQERDMPSQPTRCIKFMMDCLHTPQCGRRSPGAQRSVCCMQPCLGPSGFSVDCATPINVDCTTPLGLATQPRRLGSPPSLSEPALPQNAAERHSSCTNRQISAQHQLHHHHSTSCIIPAVYSALAAAAMASAVRPYFS